MSKLGSHKITPFLWFNGDVAKAVKFYRSIFKKSKTIDANPMSATFELEGQRFLALNGGPTFKFSSAISFFVSCETQKEVDYYWKKLSAGGKIQQCGWLIDKHGITWQIVPSILGDLLSDDDSEKSERAMQAMLKMKKLDIAKLLKAHSGK